ncbi:hypothetical protein RhiirA1_443607 [Rhizophagus irregularis]|uniref:Uncharacterized protein n=1 Tax=Rhizophagus irregularis TaxID=588596 RepID=A0A2I1EKU5_9GLOM|nr:hypothetical protein RhiirA1_443607 [Rhizophagus irregularis]PKY22748.1 hypothetical protein RhiirB3_503941 [Rhizophagus irregularis]
MSSTIKIEVIPESDHTDNIISIISESDHTYNIISSPDLKYIAGRNGKSIEILYNSKVSLNNPDDKEVSKNSVDEKVSLSIYDLVKYTEDEKVSLNIEESNPNFYRLVDIYDKKLILDLEIEKYIYRDVYDIGKKRYVGDRENIDFYKFVEWKFLEDGSLVKMHMRNDLLNIRIYTIIKDGSLKLKNSYSIPSTHKQHYLLPKGELLCGSEFVRLYNIIDGTTNERQYYLGPFESYESSTESLLAFRKPDNTLLIISKITGLAFIIPHKFKIMDISFGNFDKNIDLLIVQEVVEDGNNGENDKNGGGKGPFSIDYHFIDPYFGDKLHTKTIYSKTKQQLMIHGNVITIDGNIKIENLLTEETKSILCKKLSTHYLLSIRSIADSESIINGIENKTKVKYGTHTGHLIEWEIVENERKLIAKKRETKETKSYKEINYISIYGNIFNVSFSYLLPNDDLVIHTPLYVIIFTINRQNKIELLFFIDNENQYSYRYKNNDSFKIILDSMEQTIIREMIISYINKISTFTLYASNILLAAIKSYRGDIVDLVIEKCIDHYIKNPVNVNIFKIITDSLSKIQNFNPYYAKKFLDCTSLIRVSQKDKCQDIQDIYLSNIHPFTHYFDLHIYTSNSFSNFYLSLSNYLYDLHKHYSKNSLYKYLYNYYKGPKQSVIKLYIPLPQFTIYTTKYNWLKEIIFGPKRNGFLKMTISDFYSDWNGEALINFKWNKFGRRYYFGIWILYTIFLLSFILATNGLSNQKVFIAITIILGCHQLSVEIRQFLWYKIKYFYDPWNLFDLCACILPIITSIFWLNHIAPAWALSISSDTQSLKFYNNYMLVFIWISFSFFTVIYLLNLFIGLLNEEIQKIDRKALFLRQRAKLLEEIELFYLLPSQRRWQSWFPDHIFYYVEIGKLREKINEINNSDRYKNNSYKPFISQDLLDLVMINVANLEEYQNQDYLKKVSEIVKSNLLNNNDQMSIILEFKGTKLINSISKVYDLSEGQVLKDNIDNKDEITN